MLSVVGEDLGGGEGDALADTHGLSDDAQGGACRGAHERGVDLDADEGLIATGGEASGAGGRVVGKSGDDACVSDAGRLGHPWLQGERGDDGFCGGFDDFNAELLHERGAFKEVAGEGQRFVGGQSKLRIGSYSAALLCARSSMEISSMKDEQSARS